MEIEEIVSRELYRDFKLTHLRHNKAAESRWHIIQERSGMNHSFGFAGTQREAREIVDQLLK